MGDHNITPIEMLKHQRNTLITVNVPSSISVIDVVIINAQSRRVDATESDSRCMNTCHGGMVAMESLKGMLRRRGREPVC